MAGDDITTYDDILKAAGRFGRYQWRTYFFVCVASLMSSLLTFTQVFTGGTGDFWCRGSEFDTDKCLESNRSTTKCDKTQQLAACTSYNFTFYEDEKQLPEYAETYPCSNGWEFDHSVYKSTFTEEWALVCEESAIPNVLQSVYLSGFLVGCIVFGAMADRWGRYITFVVCLVMSAISTLLSAASPNPIVFGMIRFSVAAFTYGLVLTLFVISTEMVLPSKRVYVGVLLWYFYGIGYFILAVLGKYLSSWRVFILLTAAPFTLMIPSVLYVDESPRWLLTKERYTDADKIIHKIAKLNNKVLPPDYLANLKDMKEHVKLENEAKASLLDVLRDPVLRLYLLNLLFNWFVQSFVYYGLSLGTSTLGVDVYIAFVISGAVEIPAYTFSAFSMKYLGRKISTATLMIMAVLACLATIPIHPGPLRVVFAMIGKFAITASFGNIYVHTAEIFPTPIRTLSVGTCSVAARVGGLIAPLILVFEKVWASLPLVLFASSAILAGLLVFFLPETKGKLMPDTIEDVLNLKTRTRSKDTSSVGA